MSITEPSRAEIALVLFASRLTRRSRYQRFVEGIGLKGNETVLDFGAGWGENTRRIAQRLNKGGEVTALDVSRQWQDVAKKRLRKYRNVTFVNEDVRSAGLNDGSFDVIVVSNVLHDIPKTERSAIVKELTKKLKQNGFIQLRERTGPGHGMPSEEITSLMSSNKLKESSPEHSRNVFQARYSKG